MKFSIRDLQCLVVTLLLSLTFPALCTEGDGKVAEVVKLLDEMSGWPTLPIFESPEHDGVALNRVSEMEKKVYRIAEYDSGTIRQAIAEYVKGMNERKGVRRNSDNLYLVNKFIFSIPKTVRRDSPHFKMLVVGGGAQIPITGRPGEPNPADEAQVRSPWVEGADGLWHAKAERTNRQLFGKPYPAIEVFDYYREHFSRRELKLVNKAEKERTSLPNSSAPPQIRPSRDP